MEIIGLIPKTESEVREQTEQDIIKFHQDPIDQELTIGELKKGSHLKLVGGTDTQ